MRQKPPPFKADTRLLETHPNLKDFLPFMHELRHESERGAVLISCSYLEELLREILRSFLLDKAETEKLLEGFNAPLGTFSARATAAFCCGLITQGEFKEITTLRKIRNEFAHSRTASFE